ncbi:MAG: hypothetical protein ABH817_02550 [archaeon]
MVNIETVLKLDREHTRKNYSINWARRHCPNMSPINEIFNKAAFLERLPLIKRAILDEDLDTYLMEPFYYFWEEDSKEPLVKPSVEGVSPRDSLIMAVGEAGFPSIFPELAEVMMHDLDSYRQGLAQYSIGRIIFNHTEEVRQNPGVISEPLTKRLLKTGERWCATYLGLTRDNSAVDPISKVCEEEAHKVRAFVSDTKGFEYILKKNSVAWTLEACFGALAFIGSEKARKVIEYFMTDRDGMVRGAANAGLRHVYVDQERFSTTKLFETVKKDSQKIDLKLAEKVAELFLLTYVSGAKAGRGLYDPNQGRFRRIITN